MSVAHLRIVIDDPGQRAQPGLGTRTPNEVVAAMYEQHKDFVFRVALRYAGGDRAWAEDVTQEVFLRLFKHLGDDGVLDNPRGWFYRVATNRCLTKLRGEARRRRLLGLFGGGPRTVKSPEEGHLEHEGLAHALRFVDGLAPDLRTCFYMHHIDAIPQKEIAEVLGCSPSRVCRLLQRIERELRGLREAEGGRA